MIKLQFWNSLNLKYCGIIVRGGTIVSGFRNPYSRILIPTNVYTSFPLIFIKIIADLLPKKLLPTNQENFG